MTLTLNDLFKNVTIVNAVIDRVQQTNLDTIYWQRYLDFEQTMSRVFKTYYGTVTGVIAGSVIDKNSNKPLRKRKNVQKGTCEVACLGDRYQMDNDRLDRLKSVIDKFNAAGTAQQNTLVNEIVNLIYDDYRQVLLAPHKRMDYVVGQLRSTGKFGVKNAENPYGTEVLEVELPFKFFTPAAAEKDVFIKYLQKEIEKLKLSHGVFGVMEMSRETFNKYIVGCPDFSDKFKMIFGNKEIFANAGLMTQEMASQLFTGIGLPAIRIVEEYVVMPDENIKPTFESKRITLLPQDKIGKMMWHEPYEISDQVPTKTYTRSDGGMFISNQRTDEGRFMEYGAEWIPNILQPNRIVNFDLKNF